MDNLLKDSNDDLFWNPTTDDDFLLNLPSIEELNKEDFEWLGFGNLHLNIRNASQQVSSKEEALKDSNDTQMPNENETRLLNFEQKMVNTVKSPNKPQTINKMQLKKFKSKIDSKVSSNASSTDRQVMVNNLKKASLKRSRKRSKVVSTNQATNDTNEPFKKPQEKIVHEIKLLEPKNKKLALDSQKLKNVDIQIEKFSLLDLHSSEDECNLKNFKKPNAIPSESTLKRTIVHSPRDNTHESLSAPTATSPLISSKKSFDNLEHLINTLNSSQYKNSKRKKVVLASTEQINENTIQTNFLENLDINSNSEENFLASSCSSGSSTSINKAVECDTDVDSTTNQLKNLAENPTLRKQLWTLLKANTTNEEILNELGSFIHDKVSFWDLVKLKLKHGNNNLKTTYGIIDDYTILYSNMSKLLENFVKQHSSQQASSKRQSDNSSRSRSTSRNYRKTQPQQQQQAKK